MDGFTRWRTVWHRKLASSQEISRENALVSAAALRLRREEREEVERELRAARQLSARRS
jgi:hypothetical protein